MAPPTRICHREPVAEPCRLFSGVTTQIFAAAQTDLSADESDERRSDADSAVARLHEQLHELATLLAPEDVKGLTPHRESDGSARGLGQDDIADTMFAEVVGRDPFRR